MKKVLICLFLLFYAFGISKTEKPVYYKQSNKTGELEKINEFIYSELMLDDFEATAYSNDNLKFMAGYDRDGVLSVSDQYPAPINNSKKYLGVKVYAKIGDTFQIIPANPIEITKYCKNISLWVYGEKNAGELSIVLQDSSGKNHFLHFGRIASNGWEKISKNIGHHIKQDIDYPDNKNSLKILHIQYRAVTKKSEPQWQFFYIDDITATVRDKYLDKVSDKWGKE